ncbi:MAG: signal recognition particle receptor subunit alpha, partial [Dehalococcoidia bacterium]|nr:signal recognition particle receptor subunit alpha [Dehalococcoidia bacterium]
MPDSLDKTEKAVKRSREGWFGKVVRLFDRTSVEAEVWDELEELLIAADVGIATTQKLIEKVRQRVRTEKLSEGALVRAALKEEMVNLLRIDGGAGNIPESAGVQIILVVGVNGSGKTTSIAK